MSQARAVMKTTHRLLTTGLVVWMAAAGGHAHAAKQEQAVDAQGRSTDDKPKYTRAEVLEKYVTRMGRDDRTYVGGQEKIYDMRARLTSPDGRRNIMLEADAGAGKTALVNEVAKQLEPEGYVIYAIDVTKLRAGTSLQGEIEDRYNSVLAAFKGYPKEILFLDEIHSIQGQGSLKDVLKIPLESNDLTMIAASTPDELRDSKIETDGAFMSRFLKILLPVPDYDKIISMLDALKDSGAEDRFKVRISGDAIEAIARAVLEFFPHDPPLRMAQDIFNGVLSDEATARTLGPRDVQRLLERQQQLELKIKRLKVDYEYTVAFAPPADDSPTGQPELIETPESRVVKFKIAKAERELNEVTDEITQAQTAHDVAKAPAILAEYRHELIKLDEAAGKRKLTDEEYRRRLRLQNYYMPKLVQRIRDAKSRRGDVRVSKYDVAAWVGRRQGLPSEIVVENSAQRQRRLMRELSKVEGHKDAKRMILDAALLNSTHMKPRVGIAGIFLFDGASGMGKTELIERAAIGLMGTEEALLTLELATYGGPYSQSRLLGAGPSYVNSERGGALDSIRKRPNTFINGDEFDKAAAEIIQLFHHGFDKGKMTDAMSRHIPLQRAFFAGSSNYTNRYGIYKNQTTDNRAIEEDLDLAPGALGDLPRGRQRDDRVLELRMLMGNVSPSMLTRLRNRIVVESLTPGRAERISLRMARAYAQDLEKKLDWEVRIDTAVAKFVGRQYFSWEGGGRYLADGIEREFAMPLATIIKNVEIASDKGLRKGGAPFNLGPGTVVRIKMVDVPASDDVPAMKELQYFIESEYLDKDEDDGVAKPMLVRRVVVREPGLPPKLVRNKVKGQKPVLVYDYVPGSDDGEIIDQVEDVSAPAEVAKPAADERQGDLFHCETALAVAEGQPK